MILFSLKSTRNIFPGDNLDLYLTSEGSTGNTPVSEDMTRTSFFVTRNLKGRKPKIQANFHEIASNFYFL